MDPLIPCGQAAPDFELPDLDGAPRRLSELRGRIALLNFWSAECPWAAHADEQLQGYLERWKEQVVLWTIAANANEPLDLVKQVAKKRCLAVVLQDNQRQAADRFGAQTTPHLFLVDRRGILRYQGAVDNRTFRQKYPTQFYARDAIQALLESAAPHPAATPPYGCMLVRHSQTTQRECM